MNTFLKFAFLCFLLFGRPTLLSFGQPGSLFFNTIKDSEGAIIRTDTTLKTVSLIFSADEFGEGAEKILDVLQEHRVPASFFLTGNFLRNPRYREMIARMRRESHFLGPKDLRDNLKELKRAGIPRRNISCFLPPYEWYNSTICRWSEKMGLRVINFTPGTGTNADYTTPDMASYKSSEQLMERLLRFEETPIPTGPINSTTGWVTSFRN